MPRCCTLTAQQLMPATKEFAGFPQGAQPQCLRTLRQVIIALLAECAAATCLLSDDPATPVCWNRRGERGCKSAAGLLNSCRVCCKTQDCCYDLAASEHGSSSCCVRTVSCSPASTGQEGCDALQGTQQELQVTYCAWQTCRAVVAHQWQL